MPKNSIGKGKARARSESASISRSPSVKKRKNKKKRSPSRTRRDDRSRSKAKKRSCSRSRKKQVASKRGSPEDRKRSRSKHVRRRSKSRRRSCSKSRGRRRSPSRKRSPKKKRSRSRKRSLSKDAKKRSPSRKKQRTSGRKDTKQRNLSSRSSPRASPRASPSRDCSRERSWPDRDTSADDKSPDHKSKEDTVADAAPQRPLKPGEQVTVTFNSRPFGMAPQKEDGVTGYVVSKIAESRPAEDAGVQPGWRLVAVAGARCMDHGLDDIQTLLKNVDLPATIVFEKPPTEDVEADERGEEDDDEEFDILDVRADQRRSHSDQLSNIDDLPVERNPAGLPEPITSWQDAVGRGYLNKSLLDKLVNAGLKRPTLIQRHAVPVVSHKFGHYDLIAMAQTGSGKTFAFVIPTVGRLVVQGAMPRPFFPGKSPGCPLVLVLSPTRELAMQTFKEIEVLAKGTSLTQVCIYGGESLKFQQQRIEKAQIDVLCATPGRLIDLVDAGKVSLSFVQSVVLDEADQMLEQSLEVMCAEILTGRDMPEPISGRQTLLFSATMPQKIRDLCPRILRQQVIANLTIGHYGGDQGGSCASIKQILRWVPDESYRIQVLIEDLRYYWIKPGKKGRVVIFTNQRIQATHLANSLLAQGIACVHLHGKLDQHVREDVFDKFRRGLSDVLVATNVASRGLDFPDISLVVQFNLPATVDIYTHRIGRTGRVGQVGCALGYMGPKDKKLSDKLKEFLEMNKQEIPDFLRRWGNSPQVRRGRSRSRRYR